MNTLSPVRACTGSSFLLAGALLLAACMTSSEPYEASAEPKLAMKVATPAPGTPVDTLVVLLHGDVSSGGPADYMYSFADSIARENPDTVAAAVIRSGYYDSAGNRSPGSNYGRRDNATPASNSAIATTIRQLKSQHAAGRVIVVGHSAGANATGAIIARAPGLVDTAILVSCGCNIQRWRSMNGWRMRAVRSESPSNLIDHIPQTTSVVAITGSQDDNTYPALATDFVEELQERGIEAQFILASGAAHGFSRLRPTVNRAIQEAIRAGKAA